MDPVGLESKAANCGGKHGGRRNRCRRGSGCGRIQLDAGGSERGLIGAGSAWFGADKIAEFRVKGQPLGGFEARQGPIKNRNFPYVVLGRYLYLATALRHRTHARRDSIQICEGDLADRIAALSSKEQSGLHEALERLRRQQGVEELRAVLQPVLVAAKT